MSVPTSLPTFLPKSLPSSLILKIERYCEKTATPPTKFGRLAVNDPRLIGDIRRGRELGAPIVARIEAFIARGEA